MARKVYFSFHYDNDIIRVSRIRNSGTLRQDSQPFLDKAAWEEVKRKGDQAIINWINQQMNGTSVVIVCIGLETYSRRWVKHEIQKASDEGKGIVGIYMNGMKDFNEKLIGKGPNPLNSIYYSDNGIRRPLSQKFKTYSWVDDNGYNNIEKWVEEAYKITRG